MKLCLIHVRSGQIVHRQFALGGTEGARQASPLARRSTHAPWRGEFVRSVTPAVSGLSTTRSDSLQGSAANCRWWRALRRLRSPACETSRPASRLTGANSMQGARAWDCGQRTARKHKAHRRGQSERNDQRGEHGRHSSPARARNHWMFAT
jgi:hypothetical protein